VVRTYFADSEPGFVRACSQATRGNPFLVTELLGQLRADGHGADAKTATLLGELAPEAIVGSVIARLGAMSDAARALAMAVAVLGDRVALNAACRLAELEPEEAVEAADALAAVELLHPSV